MQAHRGGPVRSPEVETTPRPGPPRLGTPLAAGLVLALAAAGALTPAAASAQFNFYRDDHVRNRRAHVGVSAIGGAQLQTQEAGLPVDGFFSIGLDLLGTIVPGFALGFTRAGIGFGYSDVEGVIFAASMTPTLELSFFPGADTQVFVQLGATVGFATATARRPLGGDAAVTSAIGVRFWLGNTFTFGLLLGNDIGVTNPGIVRWLGAPLGIAELSFFGGLELGWNL